MEASLARTQAERAARLAAAPDYPGFVYVMRREFARNPDVVAAVLLRAKGVCERCNSPAPFRRRSDGQPFLEVHHRRPLSKHARTNRTTRWPYARTVIGNSTTGPTRSNSVRTIGKILSRDTDRAES